MNNKSCNHRRDFIRKLGGTVHNQLTDTLSGSGEEWIQLCVSTPVSDLHLEL